MVGFGCIQSLKTLMSDGFPNDLPRVVYGRLETFGIQGLIWTGFAAQEAEANGAGVLPDSQKCCQGKEYSCPLSKKVWTLGW